MNPPSTSPNRKWIIARFIVVVVGLTAFGIVTLLYWRVDQQIDELGRAISDRNLEQAAFLLRSLQSRHPDRTELMVERARFEALTGQPHAIATWIELIRRAPDQTEYRVAAVLACIQFNRIKMADKLMEDWPENLRRDSAYHRGALALAFAREDWTSARQHADALALIEPASPTAQLNQAIIALQGPDPGPARLTLAQWAQKPETQVAALRPLLQDAIQRKNPDDLRKWALPAIAPESRSSEVRLLGLSALQRGGLPPDHATVLRIWQEELARPGWLTNLAGWLVSCGRGAEAWELFLAHPPAQPWNFPTGLALTEAAVAADQRGPAWAALSKVQWPGLEDLRALCLARLSWPGTSASAQLERAVSTAARRRGGLESLLGVVEQWRWEPGLVRILQARIFSPDPTPHEFTALFAFLEKQGDTEGMRRASVRHLAFYPDHPVAMNNAAYFSLLRGTNLLEATAWARKATELRPDVPAFAATLAQAHIAAKDWEAARQTLDRFPDSPVTTLTRAAWWHGQNKPAPPALRKQLAATKVYYPEEKALVAELLGASP
jgi:hypothetical protein